MFLTYLHARIPRVRCPEHGVLQVRVPWAEPHSRFTLLFERLAVEVLRQCNVKGAAELLRLSWDEVMLLMEHAVARGQKRQPPKELPTQLGIDEKYTSCGIVTLVNDIARGCVTKVLPGKKKEPLKEYLASFPLEQREQVRAVALDMCDTFYAAVAATIPEATDKIVYDRFHVMQHVSKAVNQVRKQESAQLARKGDERLKGSRFVWLYSSENVPAEQQQWLEQLKADKLQTGRAWALKELLRTLWQCTDRAQAKAVFYKWYGWAIRSRLEPMKDVAQRLRGRISNILTYLEHRITNACSEGLNSAISTLIRRAFGYRNLRNLTTVIYFYLGGLAMDPALPTHANP
jgi:transposase